MIHKNQFETVKNLLAIGVKNYVQIRQMAGLTSDELDEIIEHFDYYAKKFAEEDRIAKEKELKSQKEKKKPWWKK